MKARASRTTALSVLVLLAMSGAAGWWARVDVLPSHRVAAGVPRAGPMPTQLAAGARSESPLTESAEPRAVPTEPGDDRPVTPLEACNDALFGIYRARADRLATSTKARDLTASALLLSVGGEDHAKRQRRLMENAAARAPDDAWVAWSSYYLCESPHCDSRATLDRLLRVDPDNVLTWVAALDDAAARKDAPQAEALLLRASRAGRVETYAGLAGRTVFDAIGPVDWPASCTPEVQAQNGFVGRPATTDDMRAYMAMGVANRYHPFLRPLFSMCPTTKVAPPNRAAACRAVFRRMVETNDLSLKSLALRGLEVHAESQAERAQWREQRRQLMWLTESMEQLRATHLTLIWDVGEVPARTGLLQDAGRWPPPQDW